MTHISGDQGHTLPPKKKKKEKESILKRGRRATKAMLGLNGKVDRGAQFANYLMMIDRLSKKRVNLARGFVADPGEKLTCLLYTSDAADE